MAKDFPLEKLEAELARRKQAYDNRTRTSQDKTQKPVARPIKGSEFVDAFASGSIPENAQLTPWQSASLAAWNKAGETGRGALQRLGIGEDYSSAIQKRFDKTMQQSMQQNPTATKYVGPIAGSIPESVLASFVPGGLLAQGAVLGGAQYTRPNESALENAVAGGVGAQFLGTAGKYIPKAFGAGKGAISQGLQKVGLPEGAANILGGSALTGALGYGGAKASNEFLGTELNPGNVGLAAASLYGPYSLAKPIVKAGTELAKDYTAKAFGFPESSIVKKVLPGYNRYQAKDMTSNQMARVSEALKRYEAGKKVGSNLTAAEATGSPALARAQGTLGKSDQGAAKLEDFTFKEYENQKNAIEGLFRSISPKNKYVNDKAQKVALDILSDERIALQNKASPIYEEAFKKNLTDKQFMQMMKNPKIASTYKNVWKNKNYSDYLQGSDPKSLKVFQLVKEDLDDEIEKLFLGGARKESGRLREIKNKMVSEMDSISPEYKQARGIYSADMPDIELLEESNLAKISDLKQNQLKNLTKILFDPSQTDPKMLSQIRDKFKSKDNDVWNQLVRNEMERILSASKQNKIGKSGTAFYNTILSDDNKYNQFYQALKNNPSAQQKLAQMKEAYKYLINQRTVASSAELAKSSLEAPRSTLEAVDKAIQKATSGVYDKKAIEIITSDKWVKEFEAIQKIKSQKIKAYKILNLLGRIEGSRKGTDIKDLSKKDEN